jgi:dipeptidase D
MENKFSELTPKGIWNFFYEITQIPRPSKKEEKIISFIEKFAFENNLPCKKDKAGNLLISKQASLGFENRKKVCLQAHLDMVCEKNSNVKHNFEVDPIQPKLEGDWVKAEGTTLGADCGIGIAAQLALLSDKTLRHGPLECLFTVDEETGLTGAYNLKPGFISSKTLINLDSEDEGELFIGCAGGIDTIAQFSFKNEDIPQGGFPIEIIIEGLKGGHSGDDINKGRANAIKILARFLWDSFHKYGIRIATIKGGNLRNAIPREASINLIVYKGYKENLVADFNVFIHDIKNEVSITEPDFNATLSSAEMPEKVIDELTTEKLLNALLACPHGVLSMSYRMPGMVQTSSNLASIKSTDNYIEITTSQRSDLESGKKEVASMVESVFLLAGANIKHSDGYPGWTPNPNSEILKHTAETYIKLFGKKPIIRSIHAGLECGLFLGKYPKLDMVSFGPTIIGAHSPDEKLNIPSVEKFWKLLIEVLESMPEDHS